MPFESLTLKKCGPLSALDLKFGPLNLIVGSNEEGKSTLTDLLIDELLSKAVPADKKQRETSEFLKRASRMRFEAEGLEIIWQGPDYKPADLRGLSLGVVREGEAHQAVGSKTDMGDPSFWRTEVRNMLFGSNSSSLNQKIEKDLVGLLGITKGRGWLVKLDEKVSEAFSKLESLEKDAKTHHQNRETIAKTNHDLSGMKEKLAGLENLRKGREDADKLLALKDFFALNDEIAQLRGEIGGKDTGPLQADQNRWKQVSQSLIEAEKKLERVRGEQSKADIYRRSLEERMSGLREKAAALKEREKGLLEALNARNAESLRKENLLKGRLSEVNAAITGLEVPVKPPALMWAGVCGALISVPLFFLSVWSGIGVLAAGLVLAVLGLTQFKTLKKNRIEAKEKARREAELFSRELEELGRERERDSADTQRRTADIRSELAALESEFRKTEAELSALLKGNPAADSAEQSVKSALEREHLDFLGKYGSLEALSASIAKLSEQKARLEALLRNFQVKQEAMKREYGDSSIALLTETYRRLLDKAPEENLSRFNRGDYDELIAKIERLSGEQKQLVAETEKLSGQVQSALHAVLDGLRKGIQKYEKQFYPELFEIDPREGVYAVFRVKEALLEFSGRLKREEKWSEVLSFSIETVLSRSDAQVMEVLSDPRFQEHLSALTAARYCSVEVATDGQETVIRLRNGDTLTRIQDLSSGTRNQFYLALRLTLLARIFADRPGVLILDDAFLTFDRDRRKSSLSILRGWIEKGWQIIYSSVQDDAMEKLFISEFGDTVNRIVLNRGTAK